MRELDLKYDIVLNDKDIWIFSLYNSYKGISGIFNIFFSIVCLGFVLLRWQEIDVHRRLAFILLGSLFTVVQPLILYFKAKKQATREGIKSGFSIRLDEKGMEISQAGSSQSLAWDLVYKSMIRRNMIMIYTDIRRAFIIPARYLGAERTALLALLKDKTTVM